MARETFDRDGKFCAHRKWRLFITSAGSGRNSQVANESVMPTSTAQSFNSQARLLGSTAMQEIDQFEESSLSQPARRIIEKIHDKKNEQQHQQQSVAKLLAIFLLSALLISEALIGSVIGQQQPLPTVIVRGFLNYRTTVDGTVLLFTPDAGQQQAPPASASIQASASASGAPIEPTSRAAATLFTNEPVTSQLASVAPVEASSVLLVSSGSTAAQEHREQAGGPVAHAESEPLASDEWRPVQATPPLRSQIRGAQSGTFKRPASEQQAQAQPPAAPPSVQADDLGGPKFDPDSGGLSTSSTTSSPAPATARAKRPSLGFTGQSIARGGRPSGATNAFQSRFKSAADSSSINGIRRPGLSGAAQASSTTTTTSSPSVGAQAAASGAESPADAANAFQSRLANANNRLRNRQRHRHPFAAAAASNSSSSSALNSSPSSAALLADGGLDVASSIEQPTEERAGQLQPQERPISSSAAGVPAVGSDEVLAASADPSQSSSSQSGSADPASAAAAATGNSFSEADLALEPISPDQEAGLSALSRAGELRPSAFRASAGHSPDSNSDEEGGRPKLLSGGLQQGALSSGSMSFDALFQNDQPHSAASGESARPSHEHLALARPNGSPLSKPKHHHHPHHHSSPTSNNNNDKLNGWLGQHHNKFVPRPATKPNEQPAGHLSSQLAAQINQLTPTPTPVSSSSQAPLLAATNQSLPLSAGSASNSSEPAQPAAAAANVHTASLEPSPDSVTDQEIEQSNGPVSLQTITKTYSTLLSTSKTRLVPLQVKSSTAIYTITENYVLTKLMTAYQTMPAGEFLLPEMSTRSPYDIFERASSESERSAQQQQQQQQAAPLAPAVPAASAPIDTQEQPISLDAPSAKSANNWLHDFTANQESGANQLLGDPFQQTSEQQLQQQQQQLQQQNLLAALLEQQAGQANLAQLAGSSADLEQLASQLDPAALLADGSINIPDLNNPLVLAAAIQNPQLAALLLAAQQVRLKQRAQLKPGQQLAATGAQSALQMQLKAMQLQPQPSLSTSFSTVVRPSTYTARDTMYTTRLVSFRDGRTVRTRTVSEPGSVVEQVLTTTVTETIPITITIKPTGVLALPAGATLTPNGAALQTSPSQLASNQATINNALFATQLASLLAARRQQQQQQQQQLQTSFQSPALAGLAGAGNAGLPANGAATPQQLLALQQLFGQQKRNQQQPQQQQQQQNSATNQQFQPNLQQLLQSFQSGATNSTGSQNEPQQAPGGQLKADQLASSNQQTPALPQAPKSVVVSSPVMFGPITTTLTSLQVRTYTVHNAFKTIFRTITSTVLIPTVLPSG